MINMLCDLSAFVSMGALLVQNVHACIHTLTQKRNIDHKLGVLAALLSHHHRIQVTKWLGEWSLTENVLFLQEGLSLFSQNDRRHLDEVLQGFSCHLAKSFCTRKAKRSCAGEDIMIGHDDISINDTSEQY